MDLFFNHSISRRILPIIFLTVIIGFQYFSDLEKQNRPPVPPTILPSQIIKLGNLGLHSASSALLWLYAIQHIPEKASEMIATVNELDYKFSYPYAFAALALPSSGNIVQAVEIAERGIKNADPDWRIPYYLATTNHIYLKNRDKASFYFDLAANTPGVPEIIKTISARYNTSGFYSTLQQTKEIWISIYKTSDDEIIRERASNNIIHLEIAEALEKAALIYRQMFGRYPTDIEDLVTKKIIKEIPASPLGFKYRLRPDGTISVE